MNYKLKKQYRLPGYDYSWNGSYFVTICTKDREEFFGEIQNGIMGLNEIGDLISKNWQEIPHYFKFVELDEWVVMPNHLHGILTINLDENERYFKRRYMINHVPTKNNKPFSIKNNPMQMMNISLGKIMRWFKGRSAYLVRNHLNADFSWQNRFHDRIIRNEQEFDRIAEYILNNPKKWDEDRNQPLLLKTI